MYIVIQVLLYVSKTVLHIRAPLNVHTCNHVSTSRNKARVDVHSDVCI